MFVFLLLIGKLQQLPIYWYFLCVYVVVPCDMYWKYYVFHVVCVVVCAVCWCVYVFVMFNSIHNNNIHFNRLGAEGQGFKMAMTGLDGGRLSIGACSLGAAQACFEISLAYVKERKQFKKPIAEYQATQFKLADMAGKILEARLMLRYVCVCLCVCVLFLLVSMKFGLCVWCLGVNSNCKFLCDVLISRVVCIEMLPLYWIKVILLLLLNVL